jgi:hypothetical protein
VLTAMPIPVSDLLCFWGHGAGRERSVAEGSLEGMDLPTRLCELSASSYLMSWMVCF